MFKTVEDGQLPTRGSKYSACVDLYAREDVTIGAGETKLIPLGVAIEFRWTDVIKDFVYYGSHERQKLREKFLESHYLQLMLRSSLSKELIIANGVGVIDLDYKDEIMIRVHNPVKQYSEVKDLELEDKDYRYLDIKFVSGDCEIKKGQRVAQITLLEHKGYLFGIDTEDERDGGFGSTGD